MSDFFKELIEYRTKLLSSFCFDLSSKKMSSSFKGLLHSV